jgi:hypothetical protein
LTKLREREATQSESQDSNARSFASVASTEEMETALCTLTESLFTSLFDMTLQRVLQTEAEAVSAEELGGGCRGAPPARGAVLAEAGARSSSVGGDSGVVEVGVFDAPSDDEDMPDLVEHPRRDSSAARSRAAVVPGAAAAAGAAAVAGAGVHTRGDSAAAAREAELHQRIAALETIQQTLEADLADLRECAAAQLGVLDPAMLHRAATALELEVDAALLEVGEVITRGEASLGGA